MRIAVIGTGISGMLSAYLLSHEHDVEVLEASDRIGGHTNTINIEHAGRQIAVDTGFIVFNHRTYPNFTRLLDHLGVASHETEMTFSFRDDGSGLEWSTHGLGTLFAQKRNLLKRDFLMMVRDIVRFNRTAARLLEESGDELALGDFLKREGYSQAFVDGYLVPMGASIWSTDAQRMLEFPARFFVRFFDNHGMNSILDQPTWRVVTGGSNTYIGPLVSRFADRIHLGSKVTGVRRLGSAIEIETFGNATRRFDAVVLASHSDQSLAMLKDPSPAEREILGAIEYQPNEAVLHTDTRLLPTNPKLWASWNYHKPASSADPVALTYDMNILQGLDEMPAEYCVTLNRTSDIDPSRVLRRIQYDHPLFTRAGVAAQGRRSEIMGQDRTYYCGAYWRYGFHEDGVLSAIKVAEQFGISFDKVVGEGSRDSESSREHAA